MSDRIIPETVVDPRYAELKDKLHKIKSLHTTACKADIVSICENNPTEILHYFDHKHKLGGSTESFRKLCTDSPKPIKSIESFFLIVRTIHRFIPDIGKAWTVAQIQKKLAKIANTRDPFPPFRIRCRNLGRYTQARIETKYFEAITYGEHIFSDPSNDDTHLGTLLITELYALPGYTPTDYRNDSNFISPTIQELDNFFEKRIQELQERTPQEAMGFKKRVGEKLRGFFKK